MLEACRTLAPRATVVYASTRQVYGRPVSLPVDEGHPVAPIDVNGVHKATADAYHGLYGDVHGLDTQVLRLTLEGRPIQLWGGDQRRDFSHVDDVVQALLLAARLPGLGAGRGHHRHPLPARTSADRHRRLPHR
ncbi:SDR family oxidoreductase [Azospirillum sp. B506]|uniref:SDR family oxidoreductase n=1 Tax=Azospirillum sp. B506 TaxID=137721 RepID=UPI00034B60E3|nr:SDR family oxidoreductase [Azospirillum sp. B506]